MKILVLNILLFFLFVQCSKNSKSEKSVQIKQAESVEQLNEKERVEPLRILDEIPQHIQEVENLTIFSGDSEPIYSMELIPVQSFGEKGEPYVLGCVEDDLGRVILRNADSNYQQILHVYNADGTYHTQLGRRGRGPGEYGSITALYAKGGKIFVMDYTSQRLNEYLTEDYSFVRSILFETWKSDDGLRFGYVEPRKDGNYLVTFMDFGSSFGRLEMKYQVMNHEGNSVNVAPLVFPDSFRIKVGESMRPSMPLTFLGKTVTALSHEDALYTVWTKDFLIKKYDANGVYRSAIYYPFQGLPFNVNKYIEAKPFSPKVKEIEDAFATMDEEFPETFPVVSNLMVDDKNRIWVAVSAGQQREKYEWWILKESGELLAKLLLPQDQPIYDIKDGYLYSKQTNEETGSEYAVKYKIKFTEL